MTPTMEHDLSGYLRLEADRVQVRDTLVDIEHGITLVPFTARQGHPRRKLPLIGAAASIAIVTGMVIARPDAPREQRTAGFTESPTASVNSPDTAPATMQPSTLPPTTTPPTTTLAPVPLPAGARIQGVSPSCTTIDSIVYDCTIPEYPADGRAPDMTGYTTIIVDDTSHVSGGCRSVSTDATKFTCYVGQRAIDEGIVGADSLGLWAPQGYIAG